MEDALKAGRRSVRRWDVRGVKPRPVVGRDWMREEDAAWRAAVEGRTGGGEGGR